MTPALLVSHSCSENLLLQRDDGGSQGDLLFSCKFAVLCKTTHLYRHYHNRYRRCYSQTRQPLLSVATITIAVTITIIIGIITTAIAVAVTIDTIGNTVGTIIRTNTALTNIVPDAAMPCWILLFVCKRVIS